MDKTNKPIESDVKSDVKSAVKSIVKEVDSDVKIVTKGVKTATNKTLFGKIGKVFNKMFSKTLAWVMLVISIAVSYRRNNNKLMTWNMIIAVICSNLYLPVITLKFLFEEKGYQKVMAASKDPIKSVTKILKDF